MTWALVAWSGLVLAFIVFRVIQVATKSCSDSDFLNADCVKIEANGRAATALEYAFEGVVIWIVGFIVLAVVWFMTRPQARTCPHCGENVAKGLTACANCGYDFTLGGNPPLPSSAASSPASGAHVAASVAATPDPVAATPPEGWYDDTERPGKKRWWDGTAWGKRDDEHPSRATVTPPTSAESAGQAALPPDSKPADEIEIAAAAAPSRLEVTPEPAVVATTGEPAAESELAATASPPEPAADGSPVARFCENCGAERRSGARFCSSCGHAH